VGKLQRNVQARQAKHRLGRQFRRVSEIKKIMTCNQGKAVEKGKKTEERTGKGGICYRQFWHATGKATRQEGAPSGIKRGAGI